MGKRTPTGIAGFDEITEGGLPTGRVTVVRGGPGSCKTLFGLQVLATGVRQREPGIFMTFEERSADVLANVAAFDWVRYVRPPNGVEFVDAQMPQTVLQGGEFDLIGMLAILGERARKRRAKRLVLDGIDVLLEHLDNPALARREVLRLRDWLLDSELTAIVTTKAVSVSAASSSDFDFLQYLADCVVSLEHRVSSGTALRFVRVAKYRACAHSANEHPFTVTSAGIEVAARSTPELSYAAPDKKVSTGILRLDTMLGGGYYRGSAILISGTAGTSKTSLAATYAAAAAKRREPTLYVSFDESPQQIIRNLTSIGLRLEREVLGGRLRFLALSARAASPEAHVAQIRTALIAHRARNLIVDPISALTQVGNNAIAERAALQLLDLAKTHGVTLIATSLVIDTSPLIEHSQIGISTIADTWMHLSYVVQGGERNRAITIVKSRGANHSNQVRELNLSDKGIILTDVYSSEGDVLFGTRRWEKENEARLAQQKASRELEIQVRQAELAFSEARVRLEAITHERILREAELVQVKAKQRAEAARSQSERAERLRLRRADSIKAERSGR